MEGDAEARLTEIKERIQTKGIRCRWRLELEKSALEIVRVLKGAREPDRDGTHGHGFLRGALIGSVSHDVVRYAPVPVFVLTVNVMGELGATDCASPTRTLPNRFLRLRGRGALLRKAVQRCGVDDVVVLHVREKHGRSSRETDSTVSAKMQRIRSEWSFLVSTSPALSLMALPAAAIERVAREQDVSLSSVLAVGVPQKTFCSAACRMR